MELLIRVVDNPARWRVRGDVLTIQPDGWPWSVEERTNPAWRIVRANLLQTHAEQLMASAASSEEAQTMPQRGFRRHRLKVEDLPPGLAAKLELDADRTTDIIELTRGQLTAITHLKD